MTADDRFIYQAPDTDEEFGVRSEIITGPVSDWATDFSHLEPEWSADPYPIQDDLRQRCPIAHTDRFGGGWLPTRYEDVAAIAYDTERFSSRSIIMGNFRPPPRHRPDRRLAADLLRPAVPPPRAQAAARRVHQDRDQPAGAGHPGVLPRAHRHVRGAGRGRRRRRVRAAHPDAGHRRHARLPAGGRAAVPRVRGERARGHQPAARGPHRADGAAVQLPARAGPRPPRPPARRHHQLPHRRRDLRPEADGGARHRRDGPAADRRHRHHLERDRVVAVAPGPEPGRPRAAGGRARAAADRDGGVPPRLRAGHHGPAGQGGHALARRGHEGGRLDPAVVPGGQPRPGAVRPGGRGRHRPRRSTGTPRSASASTAAWARTWPGWSCGWRWRSGWSGYPSSAWPTRPR